MLQLSTINFLKNLKKNNNKDWFNKNRKMYETAKLDFAEFIQTVINKYSVKDATLKNIIAKDCLFRINRDIRFSKDKTPYKSNFGASINKSGKKAMSTAGYYFHLEPGGIFLGGGIYQPMAPELNKVRQEIDYNFAAFKKIISAKKFKETYGDIDKNKNHILTRGPKGYEPDNPAAEYLKLKSFIGITTLSDKDLLSKDLVKKTTDAFAALQPLIDFLNKALS